MTEAAAPETRAFQAEVRHVLPFELRAELVHGAGPAGLRLQILAGATDELRQSGFLDLLVGFRQQLAQPGVDGNHHLRMPSVPTSVQSVCTDIKFTPAGTTVP